jgi:uncharacterized protein (DUF1684 family)
MSTELELTSWRRMVGELYAAVRAEDDPQRGHALWRLGRDELFRSHPQSPLGYGGGRYVLDTAKGADLGGRAGRLIIDLNFLYHPSCRYNDAWLCPLAPPGNTIRAQISAGERL